MINKISIAFEHGGFWMYPILLLQLASIAIIIERTIALFVKSKINQSQLAPNFEAPIKKGEIDFVIRESEKLSAQNPLARAVHGGALAAKYLGGREEVQAKMDEVLGHENFAFEKRIGFLSMFGNVATLTGLLGTITGMIKSFAAVAYANPGEKAALLAAGISEAMNATAYGLVVAIPALVMYAILQNRANLLIEDLNQGALRVFNWLSFNYEPVGFKSFKSLVVRESVREPNKEVNA